MGEYQPLFHNLIPVEQQLAQTPKTPCYSETQAESNLAKSYWITPYSLREISQFRQLIQQLLQIRIRDLMLQTRD